MKIINCEYNIEFKKLGLEVTSSRTRLYDVT